MRVCIINSLYYPHQFGGAERSVQELAESLLGLHHAVTVVTLDGGRGITRDWVNGVSVYRVGLKNLYWPFSNGIKKGWKKPFWHVIDAWNPAMGKALESLLGEIDPDVVHTNNLAGFSTITWSVVRRLKRPIVHTIRDYYLLCPSATMFRDDRNCERSCGRCRLFSAPKQSASHAVDAVVGISRYVLNKHLEHGFFPQAKVHKVIPNACNQYRMTSLPSSRSGNEGVIYGYIGRLSPEKGVENLIRAFRQASVTNSRLLIAGTGEPEYAAHLRQIGGDGVRFLGQVTPPDFFAQVDVVVVPSLWNEPFGRVVIEAQRAGKVVLGAHRGGIPELLGPRFLFDPLNVEQFSSLLRQPEIVQSEGMPPVADLNDDNVGADYAELYETLLT